MINEERGVELNRFGGTPNLTNIVDPIVSSSRVCILQRERLAQLVYCLTLATPVSRLYFATSDHSSNLEAWTLALPHPSIECLVLGSRIIAKP